jgi:galactitol PTS system EIIA component
MQLNPEFIYLHQPAKSDCEILLFLAEQLMEKGVVKESFYEAIIKRERMFPTGLPMAGVGVAIPHTNAKYVNQNQIAIAILANPVPFRMMGLPERVVDTSIVFLLALKEPGRHIKMLEELTELIRKTHFLAKLSNAKCKKEVIEIMQRFASLEEVL